MLHRFRLGCGTVTAAIKAKLLQDLTALRETVLFKVFLELQKAYDTLDWDRCLEILAAYGVLPRVLRIIRTYWGQISMVTRAGGYYGPPFKGYHGINQVYPLYPMLFNVIMDAIIHHLVTVVAET